ncbi:2-phosphosulfolactate phosphatase [Bacteroidota bacterium]
MEKRNIEVCFSPALFPEYSNPEAIVVITDILRASSAIVTAFENGVERIIPVGTLEEAKAYKEKGYMVAAERDGLVRDFADFGNSPFNFTAEMVSGRQIVYSTTNGTQAIHVASDCNRVLIGAYLNFTAVFEWLNKQERDVIILCAGWKNKFNLEDSIYAGALAEKLLSTGNYMTICDSTKAAIDLWDKANDNLLGYIDKVAQRERLRKNKLDDVIEYCHSFDTTRMIPVLEGDHLKNL